MKRFWDIGRGLRSSRKVTTLKVISALAVALTFSAVRVVADTITVQVNGAVADHKKAPLSGQKLPDKIQLQDGSSILDLLVAVGGVGEAGEPRQVLLFRSRSDGVVERQTINAIAALKDYKSAFQLKDGDRIYISEIVDDFPAPEYFNRLLWGWGLFALQNREPTEEWKSELRRMTDRGTDVREIAIIGNAKQNALAEYFSRHPDAPVK